jgi:hypothetical protein
LVNQWLAKNAAPIITYEQELLPLWSKVRVDNKLQIKKFVQSYGNTVKAWCYKQKIDPPGIWNEINISDNLCNKLNELGVLDFEPLEDVDVISWLVASNIWPKGMLPTILPEALGLNETDLTAESNHERAIKLQHDKEVRSITFNGRQVDPQEIDQEKIAQEIHDNLSKSIANVILGNIANLGAMQASGHGTKHGSAGGHGGSGGNRNIPQEKTDLIGYLGECAVYYWLKKLLLQQDIDSAWMSGYRERLLPGAGNDSLGYDFRVMYRRQSLYLEVKSSLGDPQEFELGDTEVRMARDCATGRVGQYRVIYVSNVGDSTTMQLEVLPNPLSDEGKPLFHIGGQGIRYKFQRGT